MFLAFVPIIKTAFVNGLTCAEGRELEVPAGPGPPQLVLGQDVGLVLRGGAEAGERPLARVGHGIDLEGVDLGLAPLDLTVGVVPHQELGDLDVALDRPLQEELAGLVALLLARELGGGCQAWKKESRNI